MAQGNNTHKNNQHRNNGNSDRFKISSVADFKKAHEQLNYDIVILRDWDENGRKYDLTVKLKKINMQTMLKAGIISNGLLAAAMELDDPNRNTSQKDVVKKLDEKAIQESFETMRKIAKNILVEPSYEELEEYLTDNHLAQIVSYSNGGVSALKSFRDEQESIRSNSNSETV